MDRRFGFPKGSQRNTCYWAGHVIKIHENIRTHDDIPKLRFLVQNVDSGDRLWCGIIGSEADCVGEYIRQGTNVLIEGALEQEKFPVEGDKTAVSWLLKVISISIMDYTINE